MKLLISIMLLALANLQGALISKPPHEKYLPKAFNYGRIVSANEDYEAMIYAKVEAFDFSAYDIYLVHQLGKFFLDSKRDFIKDNLRKNRPWEGYIAHYIKTYAKPGTIALDVGAHIGSHTLTLSRAVGPSGQVFAFEPQPKTFCELFMNTEINFPRNVICYWGALGDKADELILPNFYPQVETTYLFDFYNGSSNNIAPMVTLDSLNLSNISFMKVAVDGCEEIFLKGARETIARNRPVILMEICGGIDFDTATPDQQQANLHIQTLIKSLGYSVEKIAMHDYLCLPE
jgi:FkbM family methyltransferase